MNRYAYALNNPSSMLDPSGLDPVCSVDPDTGLLECTSYYSGNGPSDPVGCISYGTQGCVPTSCQSPYGCDGPPPPGTQPTGGGGAPSSVNPLLSHTACTAAAAAAGASGGALLGGGTGGVIGGAAGAGGGTLVAPGVGTVAGGIVGAEAGATAGAWIGGVIGGAIGGIVGNVLCSKGGGPSFGGNHERTSRQMMPKTRLNELQVKQFNAAQERIFHDEITGQGYGYHELVQIAVDVLEGAFMSQENMAIQQVFLSLKDKPAWGLVRTHGSMFFLEIGEPLPRVGKKKIHAEWHFLVEMCHWRIETLDSLLVGSDDEQEFIDGIFANLALGSIETVEAPLPSHDLHIFFNSGIRLRTFSTSGAAKDQWKQWQLFTPEDDVWITDASGGLVQKNAYA
jgi:hypothetical protein